MASSSSDESALTILIALAANTLVAVAKSAAAAITGSASLVAEAAHSWADAGNQIFLVTANRRSRRAPDDSHPFGFGRGSGKRAHEAIVDSELVVIPGAPHGCNVSHADEFNEALLAFLATR